MRIRNLHIKNLKSIESLELNFNEAKAVTLLYGNNGVGKTTILEALSLIGHVSSMRRLAVPDALQNVLKPQYERNSLFHERYEPQGLSSNPSAFTTLKKNLSLRSSLEEWFATFKEPAAAAIYYEIKPGQVLLRDTICFYIYFKQSPHSITQALSKKCSDDVEMNDLFALVFSGREEPDDAGSYCKEVDWLVNHFYKNTSHYIKLDSESDSNRSLISKKPAVEDARNIVSYINTDLNDFGRKNDVRESVKDILSDFGKEMSGRLALPFDGGDSAHEFRFKDKLNEILNDVIKDYTRVPRSDDQPLFKMTELYCAPSSAPAGYTVSLKAQRYGEDPELLDHMSAGENECFFIFMLLLGLPTEASLILLDEPDLHLITYAKETFYRKLFEILQEKKCQVIISTHSLFAYSAHKSSVDRLLIKREIVNGVPQHSASFDHEYFYSLSKYYLRTARKALSVIEPKIAFVHRWKMWRQNLEQRHRDNPAAVGMISGLALTLLPPLTLMVGALLNDVWEKFLGQSLPSHSLWIDRIFTTFFLLVPVVSLYWVVRFLFKKKSGQT